MADTKRGYDSVTAHPSSERQPLHENFNDHDGLDESLAVDSLDGEHVALSLIEQKPEVSPATTDAPPPFTIDTSFHSAIENPYRDTTVNESHLIRRVPSRDLVPRGWRSLGVVTIGAYVAVVFCVVTGLAAVFFVRRARVYKTKGLYGFVQRDSLRAVLLIYASLVLGVVMVIIISVVVI